MVVGTSKPSSNSLFPVLRYPGGKRKLLTFLDDYLPALDEIPGTYIEPFLGGAAIFLHLNPGRATLSDINPDLIDLYEGIRTDPEEVWESYSEFGLNKSAYLEVRSWRPHLLPIALRAARLLYLNRTCFKGNWRHNTEGNFNVGYGGQSRRWVITAQLLTDVARALSNAALLCCDFGESIAAAGEGDFLFLDPPYKPSARQLTNAHYGANQFKFEDHVRLRNCLQAASARGVRWCMTTSSHPDIAELFTHWCVVPIPSQKRHSLDSGEILVVSGGA
jgi:DNA adenine methylase